MLYPIGEKENEIILPDPFSGERFALFHFNISKTMVITIYSAFVYIYLSIYLFCLLVPLCNAINRIM